MKLGDVKIESLKIMFCDNASDYRIEDLVALINDELCGSYLVSMPGAINRCFADLESKSVLPSKSITLDVEKGTARGAFIRFDISKLVSDFGDVDRIVYETDSGEYIGDYDYRREGKTLVMRTIESGEYYTLLYKPRLARIKAVEDETTELDIPDNIAALIPYFVKGELFRDDEPDEANEARRWYEASIAEMIMPSQSRQTKVDTVYGGMI